jgi:uncharacterized protein YndB with AHSA1/START domain
MPVTDVTKDLDNRVLTITAEFAAPVQGIWDLYADARQLEQVWGPPTYPATFVDHELAPGATSTYYMTSPEGERYHGVWKITAVDATDGFTFDDYFADEDFAINADLPVSHSEYSFEPTDAGTKATFRTTYDSAEDLQKVLDMGMEEGAREAINQIDGFLAA